MKLLEIETSTTKADGTRHRLTLRFALPVAVVLASIALTMPPANSLERAGHRFRHRLGNSRARVLLSQFPRSYRSFLISSVGRAACSLLPGPLFPVSASASEGA